MKFVSLNHKKIESMLLVVEADGTVNSEAFTPAFKEVLTLAQSVLEDDGFLISSSFFVNLSFAFTSGIIHPLCITAINCTNASVCQEAIDLLSSCY